MEASKYQNNTKIRLIIENCLEKGSKQDQTESIIQALKKAKFHIISEQKHMELLKDMNQYTLLTIKESLEENLEDSFKMAREEQFIEEYACK